jgi:DNA (cytosine-5)-methyltransferase 1
MEARQRAAQILAFECDQKPYVGYGGVVRYQHAPRTTFQAWCRKASTKDLQHFTRTLRPSTVEWWACRWTHDACILINYGRRTAFSVVNIPLTAHADCRCRDPVLRSSLSAVDPIPCLALEREHWQWQFSDPASAIARKGFRPGADQVLRTVKMSISFCSKDCTVDWIRTTCSRRPLRTSSRRPSNREC